MIDGVPPGQQVVGAAGGLGLLAWLYRFIRLQNSKDSVTLKGDEADISAYERLEKRVNKMESRITELELVRNKLFGFVIRCMAYISQCQCDGTEPPNKEDLQREYRELIKEISHREEDK